VSRSCALAARALRSPLAGPPRPTPRAARLRSIRLPTRPYAHILNSEQEMQQLKALTSPPSASLLAPTLRVLLQHPPELPPRAAAAGNVGRVEVYTAALKTVSRVTRRVCGSRAATAETARDDSCGSAPKPVAMLAEMRELTVSLLQSSGPGRVAVDAWAGLAAGGGSRVHSRLISA